MDITRTIQRTEDPARQERYFNGAYDFITLPLRGIPKHANVGDWMYLIYRGAIIGRCRILEINPCNNNVPVGSTQHIVNAKCMVVVECPGERAPHYIPRRGSMGIRYDNVPEWSALDDLEFLP